MAGETQTILIPAQELATGEAAAIRKGAIAAVVAKASKELNLPPTRLIVRDIRPKEDIGYTYATWFELTGSSSATYETMTTGSMAVSRYIGIYGIKDDSPSYNVSKIRVKVGNSIKSIWQLQNLYAGENESRIGFVPNVVVIPPSTPYTIERYVLQTASPAQIILKGFVVEPIGKVYSP